MSEIQTRFEELNETENEMKVWKKNDPEELLSTIEDK